MTLLYQIGPSLGKRFTTTPEKNGASFASERRARAADVLRSRSSSLRCVRTRVFVLSIGRLACKYGMNAAIPADALYHAI